MLEFQTIGKYEVTGKLGQGGFGTVYKGRDPHLKRDVAIKICSVEDDELRRRFFREAEISGQLQHRNVVFVFTFGFENGVPYLVQEYLEGRDLRQLIDERVPLTPAEKIDLLLQVAHGLSYAHGRGVVHRDVKPANIRVLADGTVKIMDFGIAKLASAETELTQKGVTLGTASYLPPEQVRGDVIDHRADIFSFGVLTYEVLTYERPFRGETLSSLMYQILYKPPIPLSKTWQGCPQPLARIVAKCLEKDPDRRFADLDGLIDELRAVRVDIVSGKLPVSGPPPAALAAPAQESKPADDGSTKPVTAVGEEATALGSDASAATAPEPTPMPLSNKAQEISQLVARGQLEAARRELEQTIEKQRGDTPQPASTSEELDSLVMTLVMANEEEQKKAQEGAGQTAIETEAAPPPLLAPEPEPSWLSSRSFRAAPARLKWGGLAAGVLFVLLAGWLLSRGGEASPETSAREQAVPSRTPATEPATGSTTGSTIGPSPAPATTARRSPAAERAGLGAALVNAFPWGRITEITDAEGRVRELPAEPLTPLRLELPAGVYRLALETPASPEPVRCEIEVRPGEVASCIAESGAASAIEFFQANGWWR